MAVTVVLGLQWGDEGKGKIVDHLAASADVVARYQGGNNAGHTIVVGETTYKLHLIPSGILTPKALCLLGNGVVLDPGTLLAELDALAATGIDPLRVRIDGSAHVIMPYHPLMDRSQEQKVGTRPLIGTTGRGIGPCYTDKTSRRGCRLYDLVDAKRLRTFLEAHLPETNRRLHQLHHLPPMTIEELMETLVPLGERLKAHLVDGPSVLHAALKAGQSIVMEGAQGALLDLDHGTYPFVTSSNPVAGGACVGAGIGPKHISHVLGVIKAYTTRVGGGPFPTEDLGTLGEQLRQKGGEFGTTTGRARRCGWFDAVAGRYGVMISGADSLSVTKLDVLSGFETVQICTGYRLDGETITTFPRFTPDLDRVEPVFESLPGWSEDISGCRAWTDLPANAQAYLQRLSELVECPIGMVSVGADRQAIFEVG
jgi:adenylosuccinate synthase